MSAELQSAILADILRERYRQDAKWGVRQGHPDGTGEAWAEYAYRARLETERSDTWANILLEETYEALAEADLAKLEVELVQVAAVAMAWLEDLKTR